MKKNSVWKSIAGILVLIPGLANAALIAEYDFESATGTTHAATTVGAGFTASDLTLNNSNNTVSAFGNHFYHNGWDTTINANKYYQLSIGSLFPSFTLDEISFSFEEQVGSANNWVFRTSQDGFTSNFASGSFGGGANTGIVTSFSIDASLLGTLSAPLALRWYLTGDSFIERAGFANHHCPGGGCGAADVGQDLRITGAIDSASVPVPASIFLLLAGLSGLNLIRRRRKA